MKKKKIKVKKIWKIIFTIGIIISDIVTYINMNDLGILAQTSRFYLAFCILGWIWMFGISILLLVMMWDE